MNKKIKYISFDIFDTLLIRMVKEPKQVFLLVEYFAKKHNIYIPENFANKRIEAEKKAVNKNSTATIYSIYDEFNDILTDKEKERIIQLEYEAETEVCIANKPMKALFDRYIQNNISCILVSDMYWPEEYIRRLLANNDIFGYEKIFVSCDCNAKKSDGTLYKFVLDDLKINSFNLLHYGDNRRSDRIFPFFMGIKSRKSCYEYPNKKNIYTINSDLSEEDKHIYEIQQKFIACSIDMTKSRFYQLGYITMGPLLEGLTKWLRQQVKEDEIENLFFLSRDGKVIKAAFDNEGETININSVYFYASRRALIVPIIWKYESLSDILKLFYTSHNETYDSLFWKMGLDEVQYREVLHKYDIQHNEKIDINNIDTPQFLAIFKELQDIIFRNSKEQYDMVIKYLDEIKNDGKTAIVDIGWFGNMQYAFQQVYTFIKGDRIKGYYLGINPQSNRVKNGEIDARGFLFEPGRGKLFDTENISNALIEFFFSATHGSVIGYYEEKNKKIYPQMDVYEYESEKGQLINERDVLQEIQAGALAYIENIGKLKFFKAVAKSEEVAFRNMINFTVKPIEKDLDLIGKIRILRERDSFQYMAKPRKVCYYIVRPDRLFRDFMQCGWKIGFLKDLFKIPLPYKELYFTLRKMIKGIGKNGK